MPSIRYYLSERYRLRFEDSGIEDMMEEEAERPLAPQGEEADSKVPDDEGIDVNQLPNGGAPKTDMHQSNNQFVIRTLDGEIASDELEEDAINYQILLGKIDHLLEKLKLDA